jgi:hypothetical protein
MVLKGSIPVTILLTSAVVTFPESMPGDYDLYFKTTTGITVNAVSAKDMNGFTLALGVTLGGTIDWVAVEKLS